MYVIEGQYLRGIHADIRFYLRKNSPAKKKNPGNTSAGTAETAQTNRKPVACGLPDQVPVLPYGSPPDDAEKRHPGGALAFFRRQYDLTPVTWRGWNIWRDDF